MFLLKWKNIHFFFCNLVENDQINWNDVKQDLDLQINDKVVAIDKLNIELNQLTTKYLNDTNDLKSSAEKEISLKNACIDELNAKSN